MSKKDQAEFRIPDDTSCDNNKKYSKKVGGIQLLEKAIQAAIYEKALKNHYIEILYIDFEDT